MASLPLPALYLSLSRAWPITQMQLHLQVDEPVSQEVPQPNLVPKPPEKPKDKKPGKVSSQGNYNGFEDLLHISSDEGEDEELVPQGKIPVHRVIKDIIHFSGYKQLMPMEKNN